MALIKCPDCGKEFSESAPACPNCGRPHKAVAAKAKTNPVSAGCGLGCLVIIVLAVIGGVVGGNGANSSSRAFSGATANEPTEAYAPKLELQSWNWYTESDFVIAEGRVKNVSTEPLKNVEAQVTFSDRSGTFIKSDDALVDFNPIMPGQTSSFKVMTTANPAMKKAGIDFKTLMGGSIPWRQRERKK